MKDRPQPRTHLTHHDKERIAREERERQARTSRNIRIGVGVGAVVLVAAFGLAEVSGRFGGIQTLVPPLRPSPTFTLEPVNPAADLEYLRQVVGQLPPENNEAMEERRNWQDFRTKYPSMILRDASNPEIIEVTSRVQDILQRMKQSKNKKFQQVGIAMSEWLDNKEVTFDLFNNNSNKGKLMVTSAGIENGQLIPGLGFNLEKFLQINDALYWAIGISHEYEHIQNLKKRAEESRKEAEVAGQTFSLAAFVEKWNKLATVDPAEDQKEEADAYGWEMEVYLEQFRYGYNGTTDLNTLGAQYVKANRNKNSSQWSEAVARFRGRARLSTIER